ncbi:MAG: glycosyl hydrolase [Acidimicrobiales bacterium]|nr:glycosyl hydrolase [Acidimicrobiales bacterium]
MSWPNGEPGAGSNTPLYWTSDGQMMVTDHLTPMISWGSNDLSLNAINAGQFDSSVLGPAATLAKAFPGTLFIRFDWEMNGSWAPYSPNNSIQPSGETPATFVTAWQHVVTYFRNAGVTNVKWVWAPNVDGGTSGCGAPGGSTSCMSAYYPGDNYVDYVGLDGYNDASVWQTPQQIFGASYSQLEGITSKPVIITETSSLEATSSQVSAGDSKAAWIGQLATYLPTLRNVVGVTWFNQTALNNNIETNFQIDTSAAALAAWKSDFVNNPEYQGALP